jgi:transcriptional regulator with XRE-family HTH domain
MNKPINYQFGQHIRTLRMDYKFTQQELAFRSHLSIKHIQDFESKVPPMPGLDTIEKLANAFELPIWKLLKF